MQGCRGITRRIHRSTRRLRIKPLDHLQAAVSLEDAANHPPQVAKTGYTRLPRHVRPGPRNIPSSLPAFDGSVERLVNIPWRCEILRQGNCPCTKGFAFAPLIFCERFHPKQAKRHSIDLEECNIFLTLPGFPPSHGLVEFPGS